MASKRKFKKDVNFLANEIFMRCMIHIDFFGNENSQKVYDILNIAVDDRNEFIARINKNLNSKSEIKKHFKSIYDDLLKSTDNCLQKIDNLDN